VVELWCTAYSGGLSVDPQWVKAPGQGVRGQSTLEASDVLMSDAKTRLKLKR